MRRVLLLCLLVLVACAAPPPMTCADCPLPTPWPTRAPWPTQRPIRANGGSSPQTLLTLPRLDHVDLAVHPSAGWPAVATIWRQSETQRAVMVRVYHPQARTWGRAQQINPPPSDQGNAVAGGVAVGITGDGTIHAAWGGGNTPQQIVWVVSSNDYGNSWTVPQPIAQGCYHVESMAATAEGTVAILAWCGAGGGATARPSILTRQPGEVWQPLEILPLAGQLSTLVLSGDHLVLIASSTTDPTQAWVARRPIAGGPSSITPLRLTLPALYPATAHFEQFRALAFHRPNGQAGIIVTWAVDGGNAIHALQSLDGGQTWGRLETVVGARYDPAQTPDDSLRPPDHRWPAVAYDARADRLVVFYVRRDVAAAWPGNGTHYAAWSVPGSGVWQPDSVTAIPLISGATSGTFTDAAHAPNGSSVWLAWLESTREVRVRTIDLDLIVPVGEYPTATPTGGVP